MQQCVLPTWAVDTAPHLPLLQPLFAYVMPDYRYGSLSNLIRDTCER